MQNRRITSLLVGPSCFESICQIFEKYKVNKLEKAKNHYNFPASMFHPLMGSDFFLSTAEPSGSFDLVSESLNFQNPVHYCEQYEFLFEKKGLGKLFFESEDYKVLSVDQLKQANEEISQSLDLIRVYSPWMWNLYTHLISDLLFVRKGENPRFVGGGASDYGFIGLIVMSLRPESPMKEIELAIAIVHELGHNVLFLLQAGMLPIKKESWGKKIYSGVRKVERPAFASLHAVVALMYMLDFTRSLINSDKCTFSEDIISKLKEKEKSFEKDLSDGLKALKDVELTDLGKIVCFEGLQLLN